MMKELSETVPYMLSSDYRERFVAEYNQAVIRYNNLHNLIVKYQAGKLDFDPKCNIEVLKRQKKAMGEYLYAMEIRACIQEIDVFRYHENAPAEGDS